MTTIIELWFEPEKNFLKEKKALCKNWDNGRQQATLLCLLRQLSMCFDYCLQRMTTENNESKTLRY